MQSIENARNYASWFQDSDLQMRVDSVLETASKRIGRIIEKEQKRWLPDTATTEYANVTEGMIDSTPSDMVW